MGRGELFHTLGRRDHPAGDRSLAAARHLLVAQGRCAAAECGRPPAMDLAWRGHLHDPDDHEPEWANPDPEVPYAGFGRGMDFGGGSSLAGDGPLHLRRRAVVVQVSGLWQSAGSALLPGRAVPVPEVS